MCSTKLPLKIGGQTLKPGAYGIGYHQRRKVVVMDLGANDVCKPLSQKDTEMKHPVRCKWFPPLPRQPYRLYAGATTWSSAGPTREART